MEIFIPIFAGLFAYAVLTALAVFIGGIYYGYVNDPYTMEQRKFVAKTWPVIIVLAVINLPRWLWTTFNR